MAANLPGLFAALGATLVAAIAAAPLMGQSSDDNHSAQQHSDNAAKSGVWNASACAAGASRGKSRDDVLARLSILENRSNLIGGSCSMKLAAGLLIVFFTSFVGAAVVRATNGL